MNSFKLFFPVVLLVFSAFVYFGLLHNNAQAQISNPKITKKIRQFTKRPFKNVCNISGNHFANCHAKVTTQDDMVTPLAGNTPFSSSLTPAALHTAYQLPCTPGGAVSSACSTPLAFGPTIAIVDAYHMPTIENDLNVYSSYFGLPACTKANGCLQVVNEIGGSSLPAVVNAGWAMETALDVEVAHAMCQTCKILLVETYSNTFTDLATGVNTAASLGAVAISNSYGAGEWNGEKAYDSFYTHPGIAVTASSGDSGYGTEYPAASQNAVAVGGTTLNLFTDLTYASETVWGSAGSGCSAYESVNFWQSNLSNWNLTNCGNFRAVADISAVADPNTGAAVYDTISYGGQTGWWQIGGTSLSSPLIAAVFAMGAKLPQNTQAAQMLYANNNLSNFHDITSGSNGACSGIMCIGAVGFDGPTGLGTPNGIGAFGGINILPSPTASPTPTLTVTPSPTLGVSPTPTLTPSPTLVPSPTPTPVDSQPPTVSITNPTDNSRVARNNTITIRALASDNIKVQKVEFYINGGLLSTDTTSPYTASWRVPIQRGVVYTISAKAYDTSENTSQSSIVVMSR